MSEGKVIWLGNPKKFEKYKVTITDNKGKPMRYRCITINDGLGIRTENFMELIINNLKNIMPLNIESRCPKGYEFSYRMLIEKIMMNDKGKFVREKHLAFNIIVEDKLKLEELYNKANKIILNLLGKVSVMGVRRK